MGNSASKAARKYPTISRKELPSQVSRSGQQVPHVESAAQRGQLAENRRTEAIDKDAGDPDFLANLNRLGPVRVDHHMEPIRQENNQTTRLFDSRAKSELELASATGGTSANRMYASTLSELLDRRKAARNAQELQKLCEEYGIEPSKLESLARFVSSPSINSSTIRPIAGKSEEEGFMATAVWIEPQVGNK
ncbi:hypothetical protein D9619_005745 [Psilocybe cf. subviscida]|uniref:Uncharacterized protein n=1 Tax=Psilocybe cf. subviscida TaxID=2480587 RepID=A0A8H5BXH8_9AGAR|nr:hypothetical protein D9619_005745 [Psilocybe cf. subviscida]